MNPLVEQKWLTAKKAIEDVAVGAKSVECLIPEWDPVDLAMGLRWLRTSIYEGYPVSFTTEQTTEGLRIHFHVPEEE